MPQPPQLSGSVLVSVVQPVEPVLQLPNGAVQLDVPHVPAAQVGVPVVDVHLLPQLPQFSTLLSRSTSQPFFSLWSQSS
jgi:hypothetical protein